MWGCGLTRKHWYCEVTWLFTSVTGYQNWCFQKASFTTLSYNWRQNYLPLHPRFFNENITNRSFISLYKRRLFVYFQSDGVVLQRKQFSLEYYIIGRIMQLECCTLWSEVKWIKNTYIWRLACLCSPLPPNFNSIHYTYKTFSSRILQYNNIPQ